MTAEPLIFSGEDAADVAADLVGSCRGLAETTFRDMNGFPTPVALIVWPGPEIEALFLEAEPDLTIEEAAAELGKYLRDGAATAYAVIFGMTFSVEVRRSADPDYSKTIAAQEGLMITGQGADERPFVAVYPVERSPEGTFVALGDDKFAGVEPVGLWSSLLYEKTRH